MRWQAALCHAVGVAAIQAAMAAAANYKVAAKRAAEEQAGPAAEHGDAKKQKT